MKVLLCTLALFAVALAAPKIPGERILGGIDAVRGQFPYIVSLEYCIGTLCQHSCGGTIISPSWILTAGHCITDMPPLGYYNVYAGFLDLSGTNIERQILRVAFSLVHPDYQGGASPNDLALMKVTSPLHFNELIQPIPLPTPDEGVNGRVSLFGWGSIGGILAPIMPDRLQTIEIPIVPIKDCHDALIKVLETDDIPLDFETNICTGPLFGGISACTGDSGGPLAKQDVLVGVVSWGINPCGTYGAPVVYSKVSSYIDWIVSTVDEPVIIK